MLTVTLHLTCTAEGVQPWHISCCALTGAGTHSPLRGAARATQSVHKQWALIRCLMPLELGFSVAAIDLVLIPITVDQCDFRGSF